MLKQVNVRVRDHTKKALKVLAIERGVSLQELIQEALQGYLEEKGKDNEEEEAFKKQDPRVN